MYNAQKKSKPSYYKPAVKHTVKVQKKNITFQPKKVTVEKKSFDSAATALVVPATGIWSAVGAANLIRQGTTSQNRIGREVQMKSWMMRVSCAAVGVPIRILLIYDKSGQNGSATLPLITDILVTDSHTSFHNLENKERFVTLVDTLFMNGGGNATTSEYRKIDLPAIFGADAGTAADFRTGTVLFAASACNGALATTVDVRMRCRYTDC